MHGFHSRNPNGAFWKSSLCFRNWTLRVMMDVALYIEMIVCLHQKSYVGSTSSCGFIRHVDSSLSLVPGACDVHKGPHTLCIIRGFWPQIPLQRYGSWHQKPQTLGVWTLWDTSPHVGAQLLDRWSIAWSPYELILTCRSSSHR